MIQILLNLLTEFWVPIAAAIGALGLYLKGRSDKAKAIKAGELDEELKAHKRLRDVQTNTNRDTALDRLHKSGDVRED